MADFDGDDKPDVLTGGLATGGANLEDRVFIRYGLGPVLAPYDEPVPFGALGPEVDFGSVPLGHASQARTIRFVNEGPGTAADVSRIGDDELDQFPVESDECSGATLARGATCANPASQGGFLGNKCPNTSSARSGIMV